MLAKVEHLLCQEDNWEAVERLAAELRRLGEVSGRAARHLFEGKPSETAPRRHSLGVPFGAPCLRSRAKRQARSLGREAGEARASEYASQWFLTPLEREAQRQQHQRQQAEQQAGQATREAKEAPLGPRPPWGGPLACPRFRQARGPPHDS